MHDDISRDVVVSVFAEGYIKDTEAEGEGGEEGQTYGYKLEQSTSQESGMSLDSLMDGEDSVSLDHCSMFIDRKAVMDILLLASPNVRNLYRHKLAARTEYWPFG